MGTFIYAIHDTKSKQTGMFPVTYKEACSLNTKGYGIFFNAQSFKSESRKIENLEAIRCIAIDIDCDGTPKENILCKIKKSPLIPTLIVESKNGFHMYWNFKKEDWIYDDDKNRLSKNYRAILKERVIPFFSGDKSACDVSRALRMPGFLHLKNSDDPFLVKTIWECEELYTIEKIKEAFPILLKEKAPILRIKTSQDNTSENSADFIKQTIDIVQLAERLGFELVNRGNHFKTNCRTQSHKHGDKNPSLAIYPDTNSFNCFGCGACGSQIDLYLSQIEHVSIHDAILKIKGVINGN